MVLDTVAEESKEYKNADNFYRPMPAAHSSTPHPPYSKDVSNAELPKVHNCPEKS